MCTCAGLYRHGRTYINGGGPHANNGIDPAYIAWRKWGTNWSVQDGWICRNDTWDGYHFNPTVCQGAIYLEIGSRERYFWCVSKVGLSLVIFTWGKYNSIFL